MNSSKLLIDRKPKILIVAPYIYPLFRKDVNIPFGGAEVQLFLLIKELIKDFTHGINLYVITGKRNLRAPFTEYYNNLKLIVSQPVKNNSIKNLFRRPINLLLNLIKVRPDLVIQRVGGIETGICGLYATIFNKKFIYSIAHERDLEKKGRKGLLRLFYNFGLEKANFVIAQTNKQKEKLSHWKKQKAAKTIVIKSGYKIEKASNNKKNIILWVGRGRTWKKGELFIKLAKFFPKETFVMICNRRQEDISYWKQLKLESEKTDNLEFIEQVPFSEIEDYFRRAKIFVNTSIKEGFPNTFIQAFRKKTPVLSLNVDPDNILKRKKCGFYCYNDFNNMKENLRKLLKNEELYQRYAENAYNYVKSNHDIKKTSRRWKKLIKLILKYNK